MRRLIFLVLFLFVLSCRAFSGLPQPALSLPSSLLPQDTAQLSPTQPIEQGFRSHFFSPLPVLLHPDGDLYVGDQVSLEVLAPAGMDTAGSTVAAYLELAGKEILLGEGKFSPYGIGERMQVTLLWVWDTAGLQPGNYTLEFRLHPGGDAWSQTVFLNPASQQPSQETNARWAEQRTDCCLIHYITGTSAERDLARLRVFIDETAAGLSQRLGVRLTEPIQITLLPRLVGHGGFTGREITVSYPVRNYAASDPQIVITHELVHAVDARAGGEYRPSLLAEGLAVYLVGGHFKHESLRARAAALLPPVPGCQVVEPTSAASSPQSVPCSLGGYQPLTILADEFYKTQHEAGYLQGGALIDFMVRTWGWEAFSAFYRDIHPHSTSSKSNASSTDAGTASVGPASDIQSALQEHFGLSLAELDRLFQDDLRRQPLDPREVVDLRYSIAFYDAVRRYQRILDPSAYFLTAWLPDGQAMRQKSILADALRQPEAPDNLQVENLLSAAGNSLYSGDYARVGDLLSTVNRLLDQLPAPFDPVTAD